MNDIHEFTIILLLEIVKKNGIVRVDFGVEAQRKEGKIPVDAICAACLTHWPPIMMTAAALMECRSPWDGILPPSCATPEELRSSAVCCFPKLRPSIFNGGGLHLICKRCSQEEAKISNFRFFLVKKLTI